VLWLKLNHRLVRPSHRCSRLGRMKLLTRILFEYGNPPKFLNRFHHRVVLCRRCLHGRMNLSVFIDLCNTHDKCDMCIMLYISVNNFAQLCLSIHFLQWHLHCRQKCWYLKGRFFSNFLIWPLNVHCKTVNQNNLVFSGCNCF
jgi:hypothetical protein